MSDRKLVAGICLLIWVCGAAWAEEAVTPEGAGVVESNVVCDPEQAVAYSDADRQLWTRIPSRIAPEDVPEALDLIINDPATPCDLRGAAWVDQYEMLLNSEPDKSRWNELADVAHYILTDPYTSRMLSDEKRTQMRRDAVNLGALTRNSARAVESIGTDISQFHDFAPVEKASISDAFAETGRKELAEDMAEVTLAGGAKYVDPQVIGQVNLVLHIVFGALSRVDSWDKAFTLLEPYAAKSELLGTGVWLDWALAGKLANPSDPARGVSYAERAFTAFLPEEEAGYAAPDKTRLFYALLLGAYESAGETEKADVQRKKANKKFGNDFDAARELEDYIAGLTTYEPHEYDEAELLTPVQPKWPWEDNFATPFVSCETRFNIDEQGKPFNIRATCSKQLFVKSAENAIKRVRFKPKTIDGKPVVRYNVVQPVEYRLE